MSDNYISFKDDVLKKIAEAEITALKKIGIFGEAEAKLRVPVDSGTLRRSITHQVNQEDHSVHIGTNVEYAVYVEKGTSKQAAKPYLEPAINENKDKINSIITAEFKKIE